MSAEAVAIIGAAVGMLAVLVPLLLTLAAGIRRGLDQVRADVAEVRRDLQALTARVDSLAERVARIEGALTGPWRPATARRRAPRGVGGRLTLADLCALETCRNLGVSLNRLPSRSAASILQMLAEGMSMHAAHVNNARLEALNR